MKEKIENEILKLSNEKEIWDNQLQDILNGKTPNLPPYSDMVNRHIAMYVYKIEALKWVLDNVL